MKSKALTIVINEEARSFKMGNNEMCEIEELTGKSILEIFNDMQSGNIKFSSIRTILFVGLKHNMPKLTISEVGDMMDISEFANYSMTIAKAISTAFEGIPKTESGTGEEIKK